MVSILVHLLAVCHMVMEDFSSNQILTTIKKQLIIQVLAINGNNITSIVTTMYFMTATFSMEKCTELECLELKERL